MEAEALLVASSIYARLLLGGVLLWAGIAKMWRHATFEMTIQPLDMLPEGATAITARIFPMLEVGVGVLIILGLYIRWVGLAALLLLCAFTVVVFLNVVQDRQSTCFCFGRRGSVIGWWTIHRNVGLMLLAGVVVTSHPSATRIDTLFGQGVTAMVPINEMVVATVFLSAAIVAWLMVGEALRYRRSWTN